MKVTQMSTERKMTSGKSTEEVTTETVKLGPLNQALSRLSALEKRVQHTEDIIDHNSLIYTDVLAEIEARKPDYEAYVAPQKNHADAILRVSPSAYDPEGTRGIYAVTLIQEQFDHTVKNITLPLDLFAMTSLAERDFAIAFRAERLSGRRMGSVTFDGELRYEVVRRLEEAVEEQTGVHPIRIFEGREYVTATEAVSLILAWRIINRRIFIEESGPGCRR